MKQKNWPPKDHVKHTGLGNIETKKTSYGIVAEKMKNKQEKNLKINENKLELSNILFKKTFKGKTAERLKQVQEGVLKKQINSKNKKIFHSEIIKPINISESDLKEIYNWTEGQILAWKKKGEPKLIPNEDGKLVYSNQAAEVIKKRNIEGYKNLDPEEVKALKIEDVLRNTSLNPQEKEKIIKKIENNYKRQQKNSESQEKNNVSSGEYPKTQQKISPNEKVNMNVDKKTNKNLDILIEKNDEEEQEPTKREKLLNLTNKREKIVAGYNSMKENILNNNSLSQEEKTQKLNKLKEEYSKNISELNQERLNIRSENEDIFGIYNTEKTEEDTTTPQKKENIYDELKLADLEASYKDKISRGKKSDAEQIWKQREEILKNNPELAEKLKNKFHNTESSNEEKIDIQSPEEKGLNKKSFKKLELKEKIKERGQEIALKQKQIRENKKKLEELKEKIDSKGFFGRVLSKLNSSKTENIELKKLQEEQEKLIREQKELVLSAVDNNNSKWDAERKLKSLEKVNQDFSNKNVEVLGAGGEILQGLKKFGEKTYGKLSKRQKYAFSIALGTTIGTLTGGGLTESAGRTIGRIVAGITGGSVFNYISGTVFDWEQKNLEEKTREKLEKAKSDFENGRLSLTKYNDILCETQGIVEKSAKRKELIKTLGSFVAAFSASRAAAELFNDILANPNNIEQQTTPKVEEKPENTSIEEKPENTAQNTPEQNQAFMDSLDIKSAEEIAAEITKENNKLINSLNNTETTNYNPNLIHTVEAGENWSQILSDTFKFKSSSDFWNLVEKINSNPELAAEIGLDYDDSGIISDKGLDIGKNLDLNKVLEFAKANGIEIEVEDNLINNSIITQNIPNPLDESQLHPPIDEVKPIVLNQNIDSSTIPGLVGSETIYPNQTSGEVIPNNNIPEKQEIITPKQEIIDNNTFNPTENQNPEIITNKEELINELRKEGYREPGEIIPADASIEDMIKSFVKDGNAPKVDLDKISLLKENNGTIIAENNQTGERIFEVKRPGFFASLFGKTQEDQIIKNIQSYKNIG